ncbi:uncharacterized protein O3C94_015160 isoform 2-T2 [Discoglossus pictus]
MRLIQVCVLVLLYAGPGAFKQNKKVNDCAASVGDDVTLVCKYGSQKCKKKCQTNQGCQLNWCKNDAQNCWNPETLKQTTRSTSGISIQESAQKRQFNLTITQIKDKDFGLYSCKLCDKVLTRIRLENQPVPLAKNSKSKNTCKIDDGGKSEESNNDSETDVTTEYDFNGDDNGDNGDDRFKDNVDEESEDTTHNRDKDINSSPSDASNYLSILLPCLAVVILLLLAFTFILIRIHKKIQGLKTRDPAVGGSPGQNFITKNPEYPEQPTITMNTTNIYEEIPNSPVVTTEIMENPLYSTTDSTTENSPGTTGGQNSGDGQYSLLGPLGPQDID